MSKPNASQVRRARSDATGLETVDLDGVVSLRESHRVMRAYFGQYFISYIGLSCLLTLLLFLTWTNGQFVVQPIRLAGGLAIFAAVAVIALIVLSLFQYIPRQVAMLWPGVAPIGAAFWNINLILISGDALRQSLEMTFGSGIAVVLTGVFSFGLIGLSLFLGIALSINAWRLVGASVDDFFAARGWRPLHYTPATAIRRMLGVPAYASALTRSRLTVVLLFLLAGVLGAGAALMPIAAVAWILRALDWAGRVLDFNTAASGLAYLGAVAGFIAGPFIVLQVLAFLGRLVTRGAQRIAANGYQSIREWDDRPPILYLRSFAIDKKTVRVRPRDAIARLIGLGSRFATIDETVLDCAAPYGPVIAIGDPRDPIPPLGAARTFVQGNDWQGVVRDLARAARLIVLVTDTSEGVQWEVDHVLADPTLRAKSLFVASPVRSREEQSEALGGIARALGQSAPLPSDTIALAATDAGGVQALTSPTLSSDAYASALNLRLQQDFGLEVEFKRPRGKVAQVGAGLLATGVVGAGAAAAVMMAVNPQMFAPAEVASREVTEDVLAEPPPPNVPEFDDCNGESWCPPMVQIPAGSFEDNHDGQPNGRVNIGAFAVGRYKISRAQWAAFVAETSRAERLEYNDCSWREPGFPQSDADPVVCISWNDAHDYVQWLSQRTGHTYRLLTDAEWDYAARAGSEYFETTSYVSSPNDFGLYDLNRDPWEWTQDCLPDRDLGFPADGSAQRDGLGREGLDCGLYMMRGGDTHDYTQGLSLRSGYRRGDSFGPARRNVIGFRVARTE